MISNAVPIIITKNVNKLIEDLMVCINECILADEEYITFSFLTDDIKYVKKIGRCLEDNNFQVQHSYVRTEDMTTCFMKVKWNKERFTINKKGYVS